MRPPTTTLVAARHAVEASVAAAAGAAGRRPRPRDAGRASPPPARRRAADAYRAPSVGAAERRRRARLAPALVAVVGEVVAAARAALVVRDQAAVRLAGAGAADQGAGRSAVARSCASTARWPRSCRRSRSSRRAPRSRWSARSRAWSPGATSGSLHLGQRGAGGPRAVRGVRPGRPRVRRAQGRRGRRAYRRGAAGVGIKPDLVPAGEQSARGCSRTGRRTTRCSTRSTGSSCRAPTSRPRRWSPACSELGWEVDDVTAYRTVRAAPPPRRVREAIKGGGFDAVRLHLVARRCATWSASPASRTPSTVIACIGPADGEDGRGARPAGRRPRRDAVGARAGRRASPSTAPASGSPRPRSGEPVAGGRASGAARGAPEGRAERGRVPAASGRAGCAQTPAMRRLVAETRLHPADLVLPLFVKEGIAEPVPIAADAGRRAAHAATRCGRRPPRRSRPGWAA